MKLHIIFTPPNLPDALGRCRRRWGYFYASSYGNGIKRFDYMLVNSPYGKDWKKEKDFIEAEAKKSKLGRFEAGTPRINDGQLLFLIKWQEVRSCEA